MSNENEQPTIKLRVADMAYGGDAVGRDPETGMTVFAWPAIQGEEVGVTVTGRSEAAEQWRSLNLLVGAASAPWQPAGDVSAGGCG